MISTSFLARGCLFYFMGPLSEGNILEFLLSSTGRDLDLVYCGSTEFISNQIDKIISAKLYNVAWNASA